MLGAGRLRCVCGAQGHDCPVGATYPWPPKACPLFVPQTKAPAHLSELSSWGSNWLPPEPVTPFKTIKTS